MKAKDIVIGLVVLVILITGAIYVRNSRKAKILNLPSPTPNFQKVETKFPGLTVPENANRVNLDKVGSTDGVGEAFKTFLNGRYSLTVISDLVAPEDGYFYQAWLVRGDLADSNFDLVSMGKMDLAKGGYLTEFEANKDYSDYKKILVTMEKSFDNTPEVHVLEGSYP